MVEHGRAGLMLNERGATAVFVAAALVALMGIAAIAVDYSAAFNERRQDVGAADTAALGGILEAAITSASNPLQAAVDEAKDDRPSQHPRDDHTGRIGVPARTPMPSRTRLTSVCSG